MTHFITKRLMGVMICAFSFVTHTSVSAGETYTLTLKDHRFEPAQITIKAATPATLIVKNLDAAPEEFESKPLRIEKIIPANSEASFMIHALKAGRYKFVGEFHEDSAKGELIAE
ncbi:MAG: cupredoxin domain-containing protein [Methylocystis sp.]